MPYPNSIDIFTDKLNKRDKAYVIEEEVELTNGVYESLLNHDNIIDSSVRVFTGAKLTGNKVDNFILSIPSATPWKRLIKIFSPMSSVFITYESYGDQVEADDINRLQDSTVATQMEVNRYKAANDLVVTNTVNRVTTLENKKADKTYVDAELLKKADKVNTYTKTETDARIQAVVGAAPEALDTLNEIAAALNDDPNFAGTMTTELSKKVDKLAGKQLSTEDYSTAEKTKLAGVEANANKYIYPSTHPATMIVEDAAHRFVTDPEKANWNGKLDATANAVSASKLATGRSIVLSGDVTGSVVFDGSSNITITATVADDSHNHVISNVDGLQLALDAKETPGGAQAKVDAHANKTDNPHQVTKAQVGLSNVDNIQQATKAEFNTHSSDAVRHITSAERTAWNGKLDVTANAVSASKLATGRTIALGEDVTGSAVFDGSGNITITATVADDSHNHVISNIDGLQAVLDSKETPSGAQAKVDVHASKNDNPHNVTKTQVGLSNVENIQQATKEEFNTHANDSVRHITATERTVWNKVITDLSNQGFLTPKNISSGTDLNNLLTQGFYFFGSGYLVNAPISRAGMIFVIGLSNYPTQIYYATYLNDFYIRSKSSPTENTWTNWEKVNNLDLINNHIADSVVHITAIERTNWNAKSNLALGETSSAAYRGDRGKIAYEHSQVAHAPSHAQKNSDITKAEIEAKLTGNITTHRHDQYVTAEQLGNAGYGDMLKSVYDKNGDGIVDAAASVPWAGVTGKPTTFTPAAHMHDVLKNKPDNWRDGLSLPSTYEVGETIFFSNTPANKFNSVVYCTVHTIRGYNGFANCIQYIYPYNVDAPIMYRYSIYSSDSWLGWRKLSIEGHTHAISNVTGLQAALDGKMKKGPLTWNDLKGV